MIQTATQILGSQVSAPSKLLKIATIEYDPPITWEKTHPLSPKKYTLRMCLLGIHERNGP